AISGSLARVACVIPYAGSTSSRTHAMICSTAASDTRSPAGDGAARRMRSDMMSNTSCAVRFSMPMIGRVSSSTLILGLLVGKAKDAVAGVDAELATLQQVCDALADVAEGDGRAQTYRRVLVPHEYERIAPLESAVIFADLERFHAAPYPVNVVANGLQAVLNAHARHRCW